MHIKKRTFVKAISFTVAVFLVFVIRNFQLMHQSKMSKTALENNYHRAIEELSLSADNITTTLSKGIYSSTPEMLQKLSVKLWNDSSNAKVALAQLPCEKLQLENTYKFLSQVGNYALAISKKVENGQELTDEEYRNLQALYEYSKDFSERMWELEALAQDKRFSVSEIDAPAQSDTPRITDGFKEFEEGFSDYPALIYDGPFSDHILEKEPLMTKNQDEVSKSYAKKRASQVAGVNEEALKNGYGEEGKMPSFVFEGDGVSVCITKNGGFISYMLKSREVLQTSISTSKAQNCAVDYLLNLGIKDMKITYYECVGNVMTINFASKQDEVLCYTDLIKVSVALDNGEILGFDGRGYIVNHTLRKFPEVKVPEKNAVASLSPLLTKKSSQLALIPTESGGEVLCHEFKCTSVDGNTVLVYVNVQNGVEENILILHESADGVLAI